MSANGLPIWCCGVGWGLLIFSVAGCNSTSVTLEKIAKSTEKVPTRSPATLNFFADTPGNNQESVAKERQNADARLRIKLLAEKGRRDREGKERDTRVRNQSSALLASAKQELTALAAASGPSSAKNGDPMTPAKTPANPLGGTNGATSGVPSNPSSTDGDNPFQPKSSSGDNPFLPKRGAVENPFVPKTDAGSGESAKTGKDDGNPFKARSEKGSKTTGTYTVGQKVMIEWARQWYPGSVLTVEGNRYKVHYDDYSNAFDEWVTVDRLKPK